MHSEFTGDLLRNTDNLLCPLHIHTRAILVIPTSEGGGSFGANRNSYLSKVWVLVYTSLCRVSQDNLLLRIPYFSTAFNYKVRNVNIKSH